MNFYTVKHVLDYFVHQSCVEERTYTQPNKTIGFMDQIQATEKKVGSS